MIYSKRGKEENPDVDICDYSREPALNEIIEHNKEDDAASQDVKKSVFDRISEDREIKDQNEKKGELIRANKARQNKDENTKGVNINRRGKIVAGVALLVVIISLISGAVITKIIPDQRVKKLLSLGDKYLTELNYEDALAAFEKAIEIEPKTEAAYIGLANAYIGLNNYERALQTVERGISVLGETDNLIELKGYIDELISRQEKEKIEAMEAEKASRRVSADEWSFDLYDILQYNLFGKNIDEWTQDSFLSYIETNGYAFSDEDVDKPQYFAGEQGGGVSFCGGEIEVEFGGSYIWSVSKRSFSPAIEESGLALHYGFPSIYSITESEFLERLPEEISNELNENNRYAFFKNGRCYRIEDTLDTWCVYYPDEESPKEAVRGYYFIIDSMAYFFGFHSETGDLLQISTQETANASAEAISGEGGKERYEEDRDITVYIDGCDFKKSNWGDTVDEVSKLENDWDGFELRDSTGYTGCTNYSRVFDSNYGTTQIDYFFDEDGKLFQGGFSIGTTDASEAVDNFKKLVDIFDQKFGSNSDYRLVNCEDSTIKDELVRGNGFALAGWQLEDNTMAIASVLPMNPVYLVQIDYYNQDEPHNLEKGVYRIWNEIKRTH